MTDERGIFAELLTQAPARPGRAYRSFPAPAGLLVRAFVDGATRLPGVSLHVPRDGVPPGMQMPRMRGADTRIVPDPSPGSGVTWEITAAEAAYTSVFVELAPGLLAEAASASDPRQALVGVARRLSAWAQFFDARGAEALGRSGQLGLIGELLCLQALAREAGLSRALRAWTGPARTVHDFQTPAGAIEVKITTSATPERFRITSERQLDETVVARLVLCAVTAQELPGGEIGLAMLVDRLRAELRAEAPAHKALFEERLLQAGYSDHDRPEYALRVAVRHLEFMHVRDEFPRIRPADLRSGVFAVSYDLPRAAIAPWSVPITLAGEIIRGID